MSNGEDLRCNELQCRSLLFPQGQAVVTTCSHIFCVPCANNLFSQSTACPACEQDLNEPGDIVSTFLNPKNDYKATVLAGLPPSVIMEIASRAMSFWTYQTSQESAFQALLLKNTEARASQNEQKLRMALGQYGVAKQRADSLETELEQATRRIQQLQLQAKENDKELRQVRGRYDQIKRRALLGQVGGTPVSAKTSDMHMRGARAPQPFVATPTTQQRMPFQDVGNRMRTSSGDTSENVDDRKTMGRLAQRRAVGPREYGM